MKYLYPHRGWIALLALAILLLCGSRPLLNLAHDKAAQQLAAVKAQRAATEQTLQHLADDQAAVRRLSGQMDATKVEQYLTPVDRLKVVALLEHQAAGMRLTHFTYTLSPEQQVAIKDDDGDTQELTTSTITLTADAPLDTDAFAFVESLRQQLPGRARLQHMSLERIGDVDTALSIANVRLTASFEWLSNGTLQKMAGEP